MRQQRRRREVLAIAIGFGLTGACGGALPPPVFTDPSASPDPVINAAPAAAGDAAPATSTLSGAVVDESTRAPLNRARVLLVPDGAGNPRVAITNATGAFTFERLPAGAYIVSASRSGYVTRRDGERQGAPPIPIVLGEGSSAARVEIALPRAGVIAGQVLDENGEPFAGAVVDAVLPRLQAGQSVLESVASARTDDRGAFRLTGLAAGEYYVSAFDPAFAGVGDETGSLTYMPTYYPGVAMASEAERVRVVPGDEPERTLVITLQILRPSRVSGRLTTPDGRPLVSGALIASPVPGDGLPTIASDDVWILPDGRFEFRNLPPGRYEIRGRGETEPQGTSLFATFQVTIRGRDVKNVELALIQGASVTGRLVVEAVRTPKPVPFSGVRVRAPFADGSSFGDALTGDVGPDGAFSIRGLMAGRHVITVEGLPEPWVLKSVVHRGQDITDTGLDAQSRQAFQDVRVTITDVAGEIAGLVLDGGGAAVGHALVLLVPPSPQYWGPTSRRLRAARTGTAGRYRISGLPPGEYRLVASLDLDETDVAREDVLRAAAAGGAPVRIAGVESRTVDLRLADAAARRPTSPR